MESLSRLLGAFAIGFACGSVPFGVIFARLRGVDLRKIGSGNIGATNVARALGRSVGVLVLLCDAGKAVVPLLIARHLYATHSDRDLLLALVGGGAVLGHMFSPWLRFHGGKGVATGLGVFGTLTPLAGASAAFVWLLVYVVTRVSSLSSLLAVTALPVVVFLQGAPRPFVALAALLYPVIVWKHRSNIVRLVRGQEFKV